MIECVVAVVVLVVSAPVSTVLLQLVPRLPCCAVLVAIVAVAGRRGPRCHRGRSTVYTPVHRSTDLTITTLMSGSHPLLLLPSLAAVGDPAK